MTKSINPTHANDANSRHDQLVDWLTQVFADQDFILESLAGDASFRRYHRIHFDQPKTGQENGFIIMDAPPQKESIEQFIKVAELFDTVVNVPSLIAKNIPDGFLVLQDFGTVEFAHLLADGYPKAVDDHYRWALRSLVDLQRLDIDLAKNGAHLPDYDATLLQSEMDLFVDWFLPYVGVSFDASAQAIWQTFCQSVIEAILLQPKVVVHRDYHSRNLMVDQNQPDALGMIDFQDAVIGSYTYDLVSLLRDAYVDWDEAQIVAWMDYFGQQKQAIAPNWDLSLLYQDTNLMGVQRHLKVLGIFVRLSQRDGKDRYLNDIPKVMRDLLFELNWLVRHVNSALIQQAVASFDAWLQAKVLPAYRQKFAK